METLYVKAKSSRRLSENPLRDINLSLEGFLKEGVFRFVLGRGIVYANTALIKMFGFSSFSEFSSVNSDILFADEEARLYMMDKIHAEGLIVGHRVLYKKKDGRNFWGSLTCKRIQGSDEIVLDGYVNDLSDQVELEEKIKLNEINLEKLNMELDQFIYSASHDIRSPISTTLGVINLMKMELSDEKSQRYIGMMEASMVKLDYFVKELTAYAKNSKRPVVDEHVRLEPLVKSIIEDLEHSHLYFNTVIWSIEVNDINPFYADHDRLHIILFNIIKNALDFSDQKKTNKVISVQVLTEPDKALIHIFDNGIGIATTHVAHVFDMFYRATDISKGPGLGLYTVREAVTKLGGIITLNSEYGLGTSIKIELPNSKKGRLINKKNSLRSPK